MREHDFRKYLRKNPTEPLTGLAGYQSAVVIPAYNECEELPQVLVSLAEAEKNTPVAIIVVVNHPAGAPDESSLKLLKYLKDAPFPDLFPVYAPDLAGGVGEARKIGMDSFISSRKAVNLHDSMIYSLDADSPVAPDYFIATGQLLKIHTESPGVIIAVQHRQAEDPQHNKAAREYERYIFRYAEKLAAAGSPYGFVSIGSGFAVRSDAYIKAGGMRVKKAGEDFYFLQELAKQGTLCRTVTPLVFPSPRISERVPFGTGQAVKGLLKGTALNEIPDHAFEKLAQVLAGARDPEGFLSTPSPEIIPGDVTGFFVSEKFSHAWQSIYANTPAGHRSREQAFHRWFDGLKTLRFLHAIQRNS